MFLSFIVPVYNTEKYLNECLNSLITQNIPSKEYEIICVNDGSTDGSLQILQQFEENNTNVTIIDKANEGVSVARNIGLSSAKGDYIWFVDSDDLIQSNILMKLKNATAECTADIFDFGAYNFEEDLSDSEKLAYSRNELPVTSYANTVFITRSLFKNEFLSRNNIIFDTALSYSEDSIFVCECLLNNPETRKINKPYYLFRNRTNSATSLNTSKSIEKKLFSWQKASKKFLSFYLNGQSYLKPVFADLLMSNLWSILYTLTKIPYKNAKPYIQDLKQEKLFPLKKPNECNIEHSYMTARTDIIGKTFDWIYTHTHTRTGLILMYIWNHIYSLIKK